MSALSSRQPVFEERSRRPRPVFIADFIHIAAPFPDVAHVMLHSPDEWLSQLGEDPPRNHESLRRHDDSYVLVMDVGPSCRLASLPVHLTVDRARSSDDCVITPVAWTSDIWSPLLPDLEGDLLLTALDEDGAASRLGLHGRYAVPLAEVGRAVDKLAMHRVAEATIRRFLREASDALLASA
ncbi:MAG: hypothetical protein ACRD0Z_14405 [Acidimicrobiales bacterium]